MYFEFKQQMIKKTSLLFLFLGTLISFAQSTEQSPYSFFGIGEQAGNKTVSATGMGGLTVGLEDRFELNFDNPALLSGLKLTTFDIGGQSRFLNIDDGMGEQSSSNTTLSYFSLGFPVAKNMGVMVGLQPSSNVGYYLIDETMDADNNLTELYIYEGNGGTNRMTLGAGYQFYKGLSVGVEGEVLFGKINKGITNEKAGVARYKQYNMSAQLRGTALKLGLSYNDSISKNLTIKAEASATLKSTIKSTNDEFLYNYYYAPNGTIIPQDTLVANYEISREIKRPMVLHSGIGIGKPGKWYTGAEFTSQKAWTFPEGLLSNSKVQYSTRNRVAVGGYFIPKLNSVTSYWNRVSYKAGLKYEESGLSVRTSQDTGNFTPLTDFGISFGLGLPMGNRMSRLNMSVEFGQRGTTSNGLIKEKYVNLRVGLNIAEKWFLKRKID
ncbi:MAG: hypothetical protein CR968_05805 [Flavobacteriia bacterium]|nr:MAG: hypothetical protein CR968_05805 [Flavobacteriia bacterium]